MDKIILKGIKCYGYHGILSEENVLGQEFVVDLEMELPLEKAGISDDSEHTVNYAEVTKVIIDIVKGKPRCLIEAVAEDIAAALLTWYPVNSAKVKVLKPAAPVPANFDYMAVEIKRFAGENK
ncbi:MAG: dihydroneopterin aldolase [Clostridiales bacterium]|nr:dihydroneopterin aldolase [Clostridiales bacterium]MCF8023746.1 dihydroneopterin aldolase [Clostridiales bacterium]